MSEQTEAIVLIVNSEYRIASKRLIWSLFKDMNGLKDYDLIGKIVTKNSIDLYKVINVDDNGGNSVLIALEPYTAVETKQKEEENG